jgi:putative transcriptional regulator
MNPYGHPTPEEIKAAREAACLSTQQAASTVKVALRTWQYWEAGQRPMPPAALELFRIKTRKR